MTGGDASSVLREPVVSERCRRRPQAVIFGAMTVDIGVEGA